MRMTLFAILFVTLTALTFAQPSLDEESQLPERNFPDPIQMTNLWFELIRTGEVDAALAHLSDGSDREKLRRQLESLSKRAADFDPQVAVGMEIETDTAIVHVIAGRFPGGRLNINPLFLTKETTWRVVPMFRGPEIPASVQGAKRTAIAKHLKKYRSESSQLPERYAHLLKKKKSTEPSDKEKDQR